MDTNFIISIVSIGIGIVGLFVAIYQSYKVKRVSQVVEKWGTDLSNRLKSSKDSANELLSEINSIDAIQWPQAKGQIMQGIQEQAKNISRIADGMVLFLSTVSDRK
jgi:hypothetical protein